MDMTKFVENVLVPNYWDAPNGRGSAHLREVLEAARRLAGRELEDREILAIGLHDIGVGRAGFERGRHGIAAAAAVHDDALLAPIKELDYIEEVLDAVALHMREQYRVTGIISPLHALLVEADEGIPKWGVARIRKPVKYWLDGRGMSIDAPIDDVVKHVHGVLLKKVKAFTSGEPPFTARYCTVFSEEIAKAVAWAENVTDDEIRTVITEEKAKRSRDDIALARLRQVFCLQE